MASRSEAVGRAETEPSSRLERLVRSGTFCVTAEVVPPRAASAARVETQARALVGYADAVNVTDNPTASAHMSPLAGAAIVSRAGLEPTIQVTVRDRNRLALTADLLGAWALGARNLFALTGDPISVGDHPEARTVQDMTVEDLVRLATRLRTKGTLLSSAAIEDPPRFFVGVADTPLVPSYDPGRLEAKLDAGAGFVMTQITYDIEALAVWAEMVRQRGILERAAVIIGVAPLRSAKQARFVNERIPGVTVPPELISALEAAGDDAEAEGTRQTIEIVERLRKIRGIAGVHVIGMGHERAVRGVIEGAGLIPRPV
jgi:methylenetetrahydrofolate reductase (NADPH)